ncbi:hypothetical protein LAZ67_3004342 [Cordylochernes scorpioides]|uniref:CCHC-type domain-containing protein n=1 Tax=Cordylochernes scorpioides TaxID=51811 RepID=A0ABY6K989_9ARAC|nr:hypothetical protein LAZ67_3004342 [Cordylochernes scorpioides]
MLTVAYGEATLDRSNVYRWYKMFSEGREDVNDEERAGRPSTSTTDEKINEVEKMILANRRITVREVAEDLNISIGSCHSNIINDLGMRRVAAKFVPKLLNCDQKQHRMNIANEMFDSVRDDPNLLQRVITGNEAWVYGYDVETKAQSSQWKLPHEPRPKKARQVPSNVKVLLTVFFDCRGIVHHEFLPQGRTVNKEYYLQVMRNLREAIRQKRPDLWKNKNWLLHHDNAPAQTSLLVRDFLAKKKHTNDAAATVFPRSGLLIFRGLISTLQLVKKLDRYPFRKKRKIDSVEQEETTMTIKKEATNQFSEKNENLSSRAEKTLKTRAQLKGESTEFYIQDVLRLCKEVDPHMNEQDKISHLMKGIAEELYQALLPRDAHTTQQFVTECRRIEALHCKRVTPTRYERLPNVASLSDHDDRADLSSMIRQIVREEVQRALASPREEPEISAIEHMVQQEIEKTIAPISRSVPQNRAPRPLPSPRYEFQPRNFQPRPQQPKQLNGRRDTNEWRTTEGKPICFHCGRPGHVVRYCRDRRREYEGEQTWNYKQRDRLEPRTFYNSRSSQEPNDDLPRENRRRYRSPSPHTGRKGQYSSPDRRASQSPRRSRQEN